MRYESEILYDLMKRDGLLNPSQDHLPYESELKEKYVKDVEGAYPKLIDYQAEWLNYAYNNPIGEFPYVTLSDVTNATIENVVPYAYRSAILKGNTLVNILDYEKNTFDSKTFINDEKIITHESTNTYGKIYLAPTHLVSGEKILIKVDVISNSLNERFYVNKDWSNESYVTETLSIPAGFVGEKIFVVTPEKKDGSKYLLRGETGNQTTGIIKFKVSAMVYQEGMENWDIPFFTGMQSVKMPVLTTSNEDGTKTNILTVNEDVTLRSNGDICDELNLLTGQLTQRIDEDGSVLTQEVVKTVDLTILDQNGSSLSQIKPIEGTMHLTTSSDTIAPTFSGEIPVEAIEQNLESFVHLEGVEENE